jgi:hypothetical protein
MNNSALLINVENITRWKNYSIAIKDFLEKNCNLPDISEDRNLKVVYATPSTAFAKHIIPMINGETTRPIITFTLSGEEGVREISTPYPFFTQPVGTEGDILKYQVPISKTLTYKCDLFTTTQTEADTILTQVEVGAWEHRPYYTKVDGQATEVISKNFVNESVLNPSSGKKKVIHHSFNLIVLKAMIFVVREEKIGTVKKINTYINYKEQ